MKNEYKVIIGLIIALFICGIYIAYTSGGDGTQINSDLRETIGDLREFNRQAGETLDADRELQREYKELQLSADGIARERDSIRAERDQLRIERDEALRRISRLVGVTEEIAGALGDELNRAFGDIEEGRTEIQRLGRSN